MVKKPIVQHGQNKYQKDLKLAEEHIHGNTQKSKIFVFRFCKLRNWAQSKGLKRFSFFCYHFLLVGSNPIDNVVVIFLLTNFFPCLNNLFL